MEANARTRPVLGVDVGKQSHWCCLVTADGEVALNAPVANRERDLDELLAGMPDGTLVVVDQVRNIGSLVLKRAEAAGLDRAYLPGIAMHGASKLFAGDAKTDERDALVIAKTAIGIPDSLLPVPKANAATDAARAMASQRDFLVTCATRDKNRLRSILLRAGAAQPPVRNVDIVGHGFPPGKQEAQEPAHILLQLAGQERQPLRRLLPEVPRPRHAARQGAQSRGEEAIEGDLRDHAGPGPLRGLARRWPKRES